MTLRSCDAYQPLSETLIDPFFGQNALISRQIQTVGDPKDRFQEDSLRRFVRFGFWLSWGLH